MGVEFRAASYLKMVLSLLPSGIAWPKDPGFVTHSVAQVLAEELARNDSRIRALLEEADPRTTLEMIEDWERVLGLPNECTPEGQTLQARRNAIVSTAIRRIRSRSSSQRTLRTVRYPRVDPRFPF